MTKWNLHSQIKGALRRVMSRSPMVKECREQSVHPINKGPRGGKQFVCVACGECFSGNNIQIDHINPVVPVDKSLQEMTWTQLVKRMFCSTNNLQVLCLDCHKLKTKQERELRKEHKKRAKDLINLKSKKGTGD